jgi:hypothetical protein
MPDNAAGSDAPGTNFRNDEALPEILAKAAFLPLHALGSPMPDMVGRAVFSPARPRNARLTAASRVAPDLL